MKALRPLSNAVMLKVAEAALAAHRATRPMTNDESAELAAVLRREEAELAAGRATLRAMKPSLPVLPMCTDPGAGIAMDRAMEGYLAHDLCQAGHAIDAQMSRVRLRRESLERVTPETWLATERELVARVEHYAHLETR